jgi:hypothetical protein
MVGDLIDQIPESLIPLLIAIFGGVGVKMIEIVYKTISDWRNGGRSSRVELKKIGIEEDRVNFDNSLKIIGRLEQEIARVTEDRDRSSALLNQERADHAKCKQEIYRLKNQLSKTGGS